MSTGPAPRVPASCFVADTARVCGDVELGEQCSVWFGASVRGDGDAIVLGEGTNIQDNATLHADPGHPCRLGRFVTVGHNAVVHGW
jgi:carbonic anhydrase/acetyltransferase-like protein (isoleucine patch superfamily)